MTLAGWIALAERFDLGMVRGTPAYVTRGAMGEIWRLDTSRGRWAVKWQFPWAPAEARPGDLQVQAAAARAGIPLPRPVMTPDADAVVLIEDRHARVYEWVELDVPVRPPAGKATAEEAGRLLGVLHRLAIKPGTPADTWYTRAPSPDAWSGLVGRAVCAGAAWAAELAAASPLIAELTAMIVAAPEHPLIICHRDFSPDNVVPRAAGGQLVVLDWENAGPLQAGRELGYVLLAWAAAGPRFDAAAAEALLSGYAAASGSDPRPDAGFFATAVASQLNFLRVMADQAISDPAHRDYAEEQIASLLDHDLDDLRRSIGLASEALGIS
jgi:Ser/Thr protein kinase RdoA (MazF antagonist)